MTNFCRIMLKLSALFIFVSASADEPKWIALFNGKDLTGWTIKMGIPPFPCDAQ